LERKLEIGFQLKIYVQSYRLACNFLECDIGVSKAINGRIFTHGVNLWSSL